METATGKGFHRARVALFLAVFCLLLPGSALAQGTSESTISEHRATFPVLEPPEAPFTAHQSMLRFVPGAAAALHRHGGPGYITILEGGVTLYENGEENQYSAGDSFVETPDNEYWAVNATDQDMILMVTYLIPEGNEVTTNIDRADAPQVPDTGPETLAEHTYQLPDPPDSFELIHTVQSYDPEAESEVSPADGTVMTTVAAGTLGATAGEVSQTLEPGGTLVVDAGQEYSFTNPGETGAIVISTEFAPDAYSMAPDTGMIVDRTMAVWLFIMTAAGMLIVGGVLRLGVIGPRTR